MKKQLSVCALALSLSLLSCSNNSNQDKYFEVTFKNYDATVLFYTSVKYGETAVYQGDTPTRPTDSQYDYTFIGWDKPLTNIKADTTFIAQYSSKSAERTCTFYDYDGSLLYQSKVANGASITYQGEKTPSKPANIDFYYVFSNWDKSLDNITVDTVFRPVFETKHNVKSIAPTRDLILRVYQGSKELDSSNANYFDSTSGLAFNVELMESVIDEEQHEIKTKSINASQLTYDYTKVDFNTLGTYDVVGDYYGATWNGKLEIIPNIQKMTLKNSYTVASWDPYLSRDDIIRVYDEGYAVFEGGGSSLNRFVVFNCDTSVSGSIRLSNESEHISVIYNVFSNTATDYTYNDYPEVVKTFTISSEEYVPMTFELHRSLDDTNEYYGKLKIQIYDGQLQIIDLYYIYDEVNQTMDIKFPFFEHLLTVNGDTLIY